MTKVTLAIPYRSGQIDRDVAMSFVSEYMQEMLPAAKFVPVDTEHPRFSRAAVRNAAVRLAGEGVVVICDADTVPEQGALEAAVETASDGVLHLPYTRYRAMTRESALSHYIYDTPLDELTYEEVSIRSTGGVLVIDHDAWWDAGGMDERFQGWGFEDVSFYYAAETLLGPTARHEGQITHFWHPFAEEKLHKGTIYHQGHALFNHYKNARGNPSRMRGLVEK